MIKRKLTDHERHLIETRGDKTVKDVLGLYSVLAVGVARANKKPEQQKTLYSDF